MKIRKINDDLLLIPYFPNENVTLEWYQDPTLCKQVDNTDSVYTLERLQKMYQYLSSHGECYYIQYKDKLIGDITLKNDAEICIVINKDHQNQQIGSKCIMNLIERAREKKMVHVTAEIDSFNQQSHKAFTKFGFKKLKDTCYQLKLL